MKNIIVILLLSLVGCNNVKENVVEPTEDKPRTKEERASGFARLMLFYSNEKIALIAVKNKTPSDSAYLILNDYYRKTPSFSNIKINSYEKIIDTIAKDFKMPKEKVASLIFDFNQGNRLDFKEE